MFYFFYRVNIAFFAHKAAYLVKILRIEVKPGDCN